MITQGQTQSFKVELCQGVHNFLTDTFKIALYTGLANIGTDTTVYTSTGEVVNANYTAGGNTLTGVTLAGANDVAYINFNNSSWIPAGFTARGALIYNSTKGNKSVAVLNFGSDKTGVPNFTVQMPPNTSADALIRI
jgi:hypothetical protein